MPSNVSTQKIGFQNKLVGETITGGTTVVGTYQSMIGFKYVGFLATVAALTGSGITKVEILAAEDSSGTNATAVKDSGTVAADAVDDQVFEEASADEIADLGANNGYDFTHVAVRVTLDNASDVAVATAILCGGRVYDALTPATTIA